MARYLSFVFCLSWLNVFSGFIGHQDLEIQKTRTPIRNAGLKSGGDLLSTQLSGSSDTFQYRRHLGSPSQVARSCNLQDRS